MIGNCFRNDWTKRGVVLECRMGAPYYLVVGVTSLGYSLATVNIFMRVVLVVVGAGCHRLGLRIASDRGGTTRISLTCQRMGAWPAGWGT